MKRKITKLKTGIKFEYFFSYKELNNLQKNKLLKVVPLIIVADLLKDKIGKECEKQ